MLYLANVQAPIERATGLSNACQIDLTMYKQEQNSLFRNTWAADGFSNEIPKPGCVKPINFAGLPILLVRNQDGNINVLKNVCRHARF